MKRTMSYLGVLVFVLAIGWTIPRAQDALGLSVLWPLSSVALALVSLGVLFVTKRPHRIDWSDLFERLHPMHIVLFIGFVPFLLAIVAKSVTSFFNDPTDLVQLFPDTHWWIVLLILPLVAAMQELWWRVVLVRRLDELFASRWLVTDLSIALVWALWWTFSLAYDPMLWGGLVLLTSGLSLLFGDVTRRFGIQLGSVTLGHLGMALGLYYLDFTATLSSLAVVIYGAITVLFAIYYLVPAKKIHKN
jgi:hypothetical protein